MNANPSIHPSEQTLSSYGLGKLDDSSAEAVNKHLEQCPDCRKRVAEMSADSFLERVRDAQGAARVARCDRLPGRRTVDAGRRPEFRGTTSDQHAASGPGRTPRLRDPPRVSWAAAGWAWSTWPRTSSWDGRRCSRSSAGSWSNGPACATASSARSSRPPSCNTRTSSPRTRPSGSARASCLPWSTSRGTTWPRW